MNKAQVRSLAKKLGTEVNETMFRLADILDVIHRNGFHHEWGWGTWADYVESEVGIHVGASYELLAICRWVNRYQFTKAQRKQLAPLGRCKVAVLTKLARKDNVDEWLEYARDHTVSKLRQMAKGVSDAKAPKTVAIWLHAEHRRDYHEALRLAQDQVGDTIQSELIGAVCAFYIKHKKPKKSRKK